MSARPRLRLVHTGTWRATSQKYLQWLETTRSWRFRRVVPKHLRAVIGKTEWTETLRARTENEAIRLMQPQIAETDRIIALAEASNWPPVSDEGVDAIAFGWWTGEPSAKGQMEINLSIERFLAGPRALGWLENPIFVERRALVVAILEDPQRNEAFRRNSDAMSRLLHEARRYRSIQALQEGVVEPFDARPVGDQHATAAQVIPIPRTFPPLALGVKEAVDKSDLVSKWAAECAPDAKWLYQTRLSMGKLAALVGHDDATRITRSNVITFKEKLSERGLNSRTINRYLSEIRGPFGWASENEKIGTNPAEGVVFARKRKGKSSRRGYNDEQARLILLAARDENLPHRRWIPWVCAFTGCRLDEIASRNVRDIEKVGQYWVLNIPDGKTPGSKRRIPLHSLLLAEGFLRYVETLPKDGPLFADLTPDRFGRRSGSATKRIGRWLRQVQKEEGVLLVDTKSYVANHSWRHRFVSEARAVRIEEEVHDALTGHREGKVSRDYGEYYIEKVLVPAIESMKSPLALPAD